MSKEVLTFKLLLEQAGFDAQARQRIKLLRHPLKDKRIKKIYDQGYIEVYQREQYPKTFKDCDYICGFIGEGGNTAKFIGCYKVGDYRPAPEVYQEILDKYPGYSDMKSFENPSTGYFDLQETDILQSLKNKLVIRWNSARAWHQWANNDMPVIAITSAKAFPGYEFISLTYQELKEIIEEESSEWMNPLSKVGGVYLISSPDGLYVGSAYGENGIWGRWNDYVTTKHGGNNKLIELLNRKPEAYKDFRFSILKVFPKKSTDDYIISWENHFKETHNTKNEKFGLNDN